MRTRKYFLAAVFIVLCYIGLVIRGSIDKISNNKLIDKLQLLENEARHELSENIDLSRSVNQVLKDHVLAFDQEEQNQRLNEVDGVGESNHANPINPEDQIEEQEQQKQEIPEKPQLITSDNQPVIPVLVFACNRITVNKCLDNLIEYRPSAEQFPIIVSQDCGHKETKKVILSYKDQVQLIEQPDQSEIPLPPKEKFLGYYKIARHYGWALNNTFQKGYEFVIVVEDDLNVAPDFFEYFRGTYPLLKNDSTLWCVSAWNDNGKIGLINVNEPEKLYRTDFFPGLGWMLPKHIWAELSVKWPKSFWDDWIRHPEQRKNRVCIRPEISRTRTFGKIGVSHGQFFDKHLKFIHLSDANVNFSKLNLNYLLKDNYDNIFLKNVYTLPVVTFEELRRKLIKTEGPVRIQYNTKDQYKRTCKMLGLMDDFKSGVPRTAYNGIVSFSYTGRRVHLAPNVNWKGYDLSWS